MFRPFRGIRYGPEFSGHLRELTGPRLHRTEPVRLEGLPARHAARLLSSRAFSEWHREGVLAPDSAPQYYLHQQEFLYREQFLSRFGWLGAVEPARLLPVQRAQPQESQVLYRHLKTSGIYLDSILAISPDPEERLEALAAVQAARAPDLEMEDEERTAHRIWRVEDPGTQRRVADAVAGQPLVVAAGHELHEAGQRYAAEQEQPPGRHCPVVVCATRDPGLVVLPVHRGLRGLHPGQMEQFEDRLRLQADVEAWDRSLPELLYRVSLHPGSSLGMARGARLYLVRHRFGDDVRFLEDFLFLEALGLSREQLRSRRTVQSFGDPEEARRRVGQRDLQLAFFLNPVRLDELWERARHGQLLPPETLCLHPQPRGGLVMYWTRCPGALGTP